MSKKIYGESVKIPTITMNEEKIKNLSKLFFDSSTELVNELSEEDLKYLPASSFKPTVKLFIGEDRFEFYSYEDLKSMQFEDDVKSISMVYRKGNDKLDIGLDFGTNVWYNSSSIYLSSENQTWVLGISQKIRDYLEKCLNFHHHLYGWLRFIIQPILGYYTLILVAQVALLLSNYSGIALSSSEATEITFGTYIVFIIISYGIGNMEHTFLIPQLFPKIEYDSDSNLRNQIRKGIGALIGLAGALLVLRDVILLIIGG